MAAIKKENRKDNSIKNKFPDDDDLAQQLGVPGEAVRTAVAMHRAFNAWVEPWEKISRRDGEVAAKLIVKYGLLKWKDPDNGDKPLMASGEEVKFIEEEPARNRKRGKKGYYLMAVDLNDMNAEKEPWKMDIVCGLITTKMNPGLTIIREGDNNAE